MLSAASTDREQAQEWLTKYAAAHVGIVGIVPRGWASATGPAPGIGSSSRYRYTPSTSSSAQSPAA